MERLGIQRVIAAMGQALWVSLRDLLPIILVVLFFQLFVFRQPLPQAGKLGAGLGFVVVGLSLFIKGLEMGLFPLGEEMASQLTASIRTTAVNPWYSYYCTYIFAFAIGMSTTIAEPALIAVAMKAEEVSGGTIQSFWLRMAVALGVGIGVALGTFRIVVGIPLPYFILTG